MKNILILGVAAVQAEAIEKLNEMGYKTYAIAKKNDGPGSKIAYQFDEIDILDKEGIKKHVIDNKIDAIYSVGSDLAMPIVSKISEEFNLPHFVSFEAANICNHKNLMREVTKGAYGSIDFEVTKDINYKTLLEYPLFVKPSDGQGQRGISLVENDAELHEALSKAIDNSRNKKAIIEKYIGGYEVSVNLYVVNSKVVFEKTSLRDTWTKYEGLIHKHIIDNNVIFPTDKIQRAIEEHIKLIDIKNGPLYAQIKIYEDNPYIIEITPRFDGCHMHKLIKYSMNIDLLKITFDHLLNNITPSFENLTINKNYTLEFICKEPNTKANYDIYSYPENTVEKYNYYKNGDLIRPVNGVYDKIGYVIYSNNNN